MPLQDRISSRHIAWALLLLTLAGLGHLGHQRYMAIGTDKGGKKKTARAIPVLVEPIRHEAIEARRTFSGTLEARVELAVAPKVAGRVTWIRAQLADTVTRGQVVAELDNAEHLQAVAQARAEVAVAQANLAEARIVLANADRDLERARRLRGQGVSTEVQLDAALANREARKAQLEVAHAQVTRAQALLEAANIRLGYTRVAADWSGGADRRQVAERLVEAGQTVAANTPLLRLVELDPLTGVVFVTEKDYPRLRPGQTLTLRADAYPDRTFPGRIERIAPVFRQATRQARVELIVDNPGTPLKPGMFIRATVVLERLEEATIVPVQALSRRAESDGLFVLSGDGATVAWRPVTVGIRQGERVQVRGDGLSGRVVTLGQQLLDDGVAVSLPDAAATPAVPTGKKTGNQAEGGR